MLKKIQSMLGIVIVLLSLVNTSSVALAAPLGEGEPQRAAKDWGDQFITNAELQDSAGQVKESFGMYDDMRAQWNFKITAGTIIQPGDTMTLKVPEVLGLGNSAAFGINDEQGNTIGNAQVSPTTGDIVITFTDAITEAETAAINGQFYLGVKWVEVKVSFDEKVEIKWTENISSTVTIASGSFRPEDNEGIKKWGYIDAEDPALIHWTARINFSENLDTTINNAIFQDELGPNQKLVPGSVSGFYVIGWEDNLYAKAGERIPNSMINMTDDTHFTVTFGDLKGPVYIKGTSNNYQLIHL